MVPGGGGAVRGMSQPPLPVARDVNRRGAAGFRAVRPGGNPDRGMVAPLVAVGLEGNLHCGTGVYLVALPST